MTELLIFPYSGNGLEIIDCLNNKYHFAGFIDDDKKKQTIKKGNYNVYGREILGKKTTAKILVAPASPNTFLKFKKIIGGFKIEPKRFATIVHPKAIVSKQAKIGYNTVILGGAVITSNATIGNHVWISPNVVIHHDVVIGDYCIIGSGVIIAGKTTIQENCFIGSGSSIIGNITVGRNSLIGLGTNVIDSIPAGSKVVGNPARQI